MMISILALLVLLLPLALSSSIAIIGAGIGGTFTSKYLTELLPPDDLCDTHIVIYEADTIGGRVRSQEILNFSNTVVELGASIAYTGNKYIAEQALRNFYLKVPAEDDPSKTFGIFNGDSFSFMEAQWAFVPSFVSKLYNKACLLYRYHWSLTGLTNLVKQAVSSFEQIYKLQEEQQQAFTTPDELWNTVGLGNYTNISFSELLSTHRLDEDVSPFQSELAAAVNRVNYNAPNHELSALAGLVSFVPMISGSLFAIDGGNQLLAASALDDTLQAFESCPLTHPNHPHNPKGLLQFHKITQIIYHPNLTDGGKFSLYHRQRRPVTPVAQTSEAGPDGERGEETAGEDPQEQEYEVVNVWLGDYDHVVLACPLQLAQIDFFISPSLEPHHQGDPGKVRSLSLQLTTDPTSKGTPCLPLVYIMIYTSCLSYIYILIY